MCLFLPGAPMKFQSVFPVGMETAEGPWVGARLLVWALAAASLVVTQVNYVQPVYSSCRTAFSVCHSSLPLNSPKLPFPGPKLSLLPAPALSSQPWLPLFVKTGLNLMPPACLFWKPLHSSVLRDAQRVFSQVKQKILHWHPQNHRWSPQPPSSNDGQIWNDCF